MDNIQAEKEKQYQARSSSLPEIKEKAESIQSGLTSNKHKPNLLFVQKKESTVYVNSKTSLGLQNSPIQQLQQNQDLKFKQRKRKNSTKSDKKQQKNIDAKKLKKEFQNKKNGRLVTEKQIIYPSNYQDKKIQDNTHASSKLLLRNSEMNVNEEDQQLSKEILSYKSPQIELQIQESYNMQQNDHVVQIQTSQDDEQSLQDIANRVKFQYQEDTDEATIQDIDEDESGKKTNNKNQNASNIFSSPADKNVDKKQSPIIFKQMGSIKEDEESIRNIERGLSSFSDENSVDPGLNDYHRNLKKNNSKSKSKYKINEQKDLFKQEKQNQKSIIKVYQPNNRSKSLLRERSSKKTFNRTFSLFGLTTNSNSKKDIFIDPLPNLEKIANITKFSPMQAANIFYDKHIIQALDKFKSQEHHLQHLKSVKEKIKKMKAGKLDRIINVQIDPRLTAMNISPSNISLAQTIIKFPLNERSELRRIQVQRNHSNGRNFQINQEMMRIYQQNLSLQQKLDLIQNKGSGNYLSRNSTQSTWVASPQKNTQQVQKVKKGSLNQIFKKNEFLRIEQENLKMAQRIVCQKPSFSNEEIEKDYQRFKKVKDAINNRKKLNIETMINQKRDKFQHIENGQKNMEALSQIKQNFDNDSLLNNKQSQRKFQLPQIQIQKQQYD